MHNTLRDALAIEVGKLIDQVRVLQQDGAERANRQAVLVVRHLRRSNEIFVRTTTSRAVALLTGDPQPVVSTVFFSSVIGVAATANETKKGQSRAIRDI